MPAATPRSKNPRPQCEGCPYYQSGPGCGFLDAGTPCAHHAEKWRFAAAPDEPAPVLEEPTEGQLMLF